MRTYQPIWEALKAKNKVKITTPRALHKRVIKAVIKEKWMDLGFKLELSEAGKNDPKLVIKQEDTFIVFTLRFAGLSEDDI